MKSLLRRFVYLLLLLAVALSVASRVRVLKWEPSAAPLRPADETARAKAQEAYGKLPLSFEANQGQADGRIKFLSRGANYNFLLAATEATLQLRDGGDSARQPTTVRIKFVGANSQAQIEGLDELAGKNNYLIGADRSRWRTNIPNYARVRYDEVWPGIDVVFYGNQRQLEYDFVVAPGADPRAIKLSFEGTKKISVDGNGDLILHVAEGELRQRKPVVYQEVNGERRMVNGRYAVKGNQVGFELGRYDRRHELVIDPVLVYSARTMAGSGIAVDAQGAAYIVGTVDSLFSEFVRVTDLLITKLNPEGSQQVYSTVVGGSGMDESRGIAVDAAGNVYVTGATYSTDFPSSFPGAPSNVGAGICFKSADGGAGWSNSGRGLTVFRGGTLSAVVIDPANPSVIYAGSSYSAANVLGKSIDGGNRWTNIQLSGVSDVRPLAVAPGNPNTIFISTGQGLRKSADGGMTWSETGLSRAGVFSLITDRNNPANLYAAQLFTIFKSVDGGNSWSEAISGLPGGIRIKSLALDSANPSTLYVAFSGGGTSFDKVYKSVDRAATWEAVNTFVPETDVLALAVHPTNSTIYAGTGRGVLKSGDGGRNWQSVGLTEFQVRLLVFDPANPSTIYASADSAIQSEGRGVYKSADGGMSWSATGATLSKSRVAALAIDPLNPATLYAGTSDNAEAFVLKLDSAGRNVVYATYYSGPGDEQGASIAVDLAGNAYITGATDSRQPPPLVNNLPVASGMGFMAKLNSQGTSFVYSTLLAGAGAGIAVDRTGKAYVTGRIFPQFPMMAKNGFKTSQDDGSEMDAFFIKLDPEKAGDESLLYATYLGGGIREEGRAIAVDAGGQAYVTGFAQAGFSVSGEPDGSVFLAKIDPSKSGATSLIWRSELGSGLVNGVAVDAAGDAYLVGTTNEANFPVTPGAYQTNLSGGICQRIPVCNPPPQMPCTCTAFPKPGCPPPTSFIDIPCNDAFVMKINAAGTALLYSTYLGNNGTGEEGRSIAADAAKNVYVTGSGRVPFTSGAFQNPGGSGFIAKLTLGARSTAVGAVSAASYVGPQLAQESMAVGFLDAFGAGAENLRAKVRDSAGREREAQVFFSGFGQINFQIPPGTAEGAALVRITSGGAAIASGSFQVVKIAPGVFSADASGRGLAAAVAQRAKPDGTVTYEAVYRFDPAQNKFVAIPIDFGPEGDQMFLALFGTGWRFRSSEAAVKVTVGGVDAPVTYAGLQPTLVGVDQINALLPRSLAGRGEVDVVVTVDGKMANIVQVSIK
ncbi:MAG: SBBP repeat-containing protein [Blastocatellia bacterium]